MGRSRGVATAGDDETSQSSKRRRVPSGGDALENITSQGGTDGKKTLYHCNYCNKDISGKSRIECSKCPDFDLCVECFSVGAEVTLHKSNHPYRVMATSGEERSCSICNTTKTPLWRGGPSGPKSLCNACGIKYRKKRREALVLESGGVKKENNKRREEEESGVSEKKSNKSSIKLKMVGLEGQMVISKKKRKMMMKMGEEVRAAILLMALSSRSGCVQA